MKPFDRILYVAASSLAQVPALSRAVSLAESFQADLTVVDVVPVLPAGVGGPPGGPLSTRVQSTMVSRRRAELEELVAPYQHRRGIEIEVLAGQGFLELIRTVLRKRHDLLIKPAENPAFLERLFGSTDMHLLRKCPCPVWLTGPEEKPSSRCILAAVDFNWDDRSNTVGQSLNRQILGLASSLALLDAAALHVVHVWDAPAEIMVRSWAVDPSEAGAAYVEGERLSHEWAFSQLREQFRDETGWEAHERLSPEFHLHRGAAATVIPEMAKRLQADLIVMGTVARTGIAGLLIGNTAEAILEQIRCSVLAVKPLGFVSPVGLPD